MTRSKLLYADERGRCVSIASRQPAVDTPACSLGSQGRARDAEAPLEIFEPLRHEPQTEASVAPTGRLVAAGAVVTHAKLAARRFDPDCHVDRRCMLFGFS